MGSSVRLDKYLANMMIGTRSEVKGYIRKGRVQVDGQVVKNSDRKIETGRTEVLFDNRRIGYEACVYYMLNKPAGVVSATRDPVSRTVIDLLGEDGRKDIFPVGRLDKDTEGLLLITNDGVLAHELLSPKKQVGKVYFARVKGKVTKQEEELFLRGVKIEEDFTALPSELKIIKSAEVSEIQLTIYEGKFHQVKRMFEAVGMEVVYLKRLSMGGLKLDETLSCGEYRRLTDEELRILKEKQS